MSNCRLEKKGCVEAYMRNGGPACWTEQEIRRNCDGYSGVTCDDCGERFCQLSPMRPSCVSIRGKEHNLCAVCQRPYAVHRAHWTYNTYWAVEERKRAEKHHEAMHEMRLRFEANIARMPFDAEPDF